MRSDKDIPREKSDGTADFERPPTVLPAVSLEIYLFILTSVSILAKSFPREIDRIGQFRAAPNGPSGGLQRVCSRLRSAAQRHPQIAGTIGFPSLKR
jgi:hypothetical protein